MDQFKPAQARHIFSWNAVSLGGFSVKEVLCQVWLQVAFGVGLTGNQANVGIGRHVVIDEGTMQIFGAKSVNW